MLMGWQLLRFLCQASPPRPDLMEFVEAFASRVLRQGSALKDFVLPDVGDPLKNNIHVIT